VAVGERSGKNNSKTIDNLKKIYEVSSKSFRTFIFWRETVRAGGVVIGHV